MSFDKDSLIGDIYAAAVDASAWGKVLSQLSLAFSGHTAIYERLHDSPETHQLLATDLDPEFVRTYNEHYNARNIWATGPLNQTASLMVSEWIIEPAALERTQFYAEWLRPQGLKHAATAPLLRQKHRSLNLGFVRGQGRGSYSAEEASLMADLLPHLRRAVEIAARLEDTALAHQASLDTLAAEGTCLMIVGGSGDIYFLSPQAEHLLGERSVVTSRAGRLCGIGRADESKLGRAIFKATNVDGVAEGSLLVLSGSDHAGRFSVSVTPIRSERAGLFREKRLCVVLVAKPLEAGVPSAEVLATLFGLTPAEARLANALGRGESLTDYADLNRVSVATVKTHLSSLFSKAGVNRQVDLVRMICADPVFSRSIN